jgi:hypothetical protein
MYTQHLYLSLSNIDEDLNSDVINLLSNLKNQLCSTILLGCNGGIDASGETGV